MAQNGWASSVEADTYFSDERPVTALWDALADATAKNKVLNSAYNRLYYHPDYALPEAGSETAAQLVILIKAQSEMSYYILMHLEDEDRRKGIQVQAVIEAGIVKEEYDPARASEIPIPPVVAALLDGFSSLESFGQIDIDRDEDESVNTKVDEF